MAKIRLRSEPLGANSHVEMSLMPPANESVGVSQIPSFVANAASQRSIPVDLKPCEGHLLVNANTVTQLRSYLPTLPAGTRGRRHSRWKGSGKRRQRVIGCFK